MAAGLEELLGGRFVFVVGKGGVGKSTAACALALSFADAGRRTHLLSTDPAHSVGDLFGRDLAGAGPSVSPCSRNLMLEEIDASARMHDWLARVAEPLSELVELGTYLDREDVEALVDIVVPGADELMAALRLVELQAEELDRIVVDTAPTGHTLRMLDSGGVLERWSRSFQAMAAKAGAVQEALLRRPIRFDAEVVLEELRSDVSSFEERVLGSAQCLVISRADRVVRSETGRLIRSLSARGIETAAELRVGGGPPAAPREVASFEAPFIEASPGKGPSGCAGLRHFGAALIAASSLYTGRRDTVLPAAKPLERASSGRTSPSPGATLGPELFERELLFFAGKGGVGKSTCAASAALALSERRDVVLLGTDPAGSLGDLLGEAEEPGGGRGAGGRLLAREIHADIAFENFRTRYREGIGELFERLGLDRSARLDRAVAESLLDLAPPGIDEIFGLHGLLEARAGPEGRCVVVDAAPTGHFLRLMEMPRTALDWTHAVLRILLKYRSVLGLDGPAADLLAFARSVRGLLGLLGDPRRTGVVVVTLDAAAVESETRRLLDTLRRSDIPVLAVLTNRSGDADRLGGAGPGAAIRIRAPLLPEPPIGVEALRLFFSRWELVE